VVELLIHYMAPIMFMALVVFLLLGYPVAFSLGAVGLIFGFIGIQVGLFRPDFLQALPERIYGIMNNDVLLAIPFFTFMGLILERSGMAEDLLDTIGQLFGTIRGGLAYAVVFVGALLAATTGVVAASVISMGLISLPIMLRYGYDRRVASGVIARADRHGRPARPFGRRHVRGRVPARPDARGHVCGLHLPREHPLSESCAGAASRGHRLS
jgi:TRAP-type mannitol/chloroaromatic compound transport system permease large subunit